MGCCGTDGFAACAIVHSWVPQSRFGDGGLTQAVFSGKSCLSSVKMARLCRARVGASPVKCGADGLHATLEEVF